MPYIYVIFILPFSFNRYGLLMLAFLTGFLLDSISNTYGMHAAACTTLAFAKYYSEKWILDVDSIQLQGYQFVAPGYKGMPFYSIYITVLIFIHHFVFFQLNYFKLSAFFTVMAVSILSTILTFAFILLFRALFSKSK